MLYVQLLPMNNEALFSSLLIPEYIKFRARVIITSTILVLVYKIAELRDRWHDVYLGYW